MAERRKETEADWEKEQQWMGWGLGKKKKEGQRGDRAEEHQEVVGKEEE